MVSRARRQPCLKDSMSSASLRVLKVGGSVPGAPRGRYPMFAVGHRCRKKRGSTPVLRYREAGGLGVEYERKASSSILVVDDDAAFREFVQALMDEAGLRTVEARLGHEAVDSRHSSTTSTGGRRGRPAGHLRVRGPPPPAPGPRRAAAGDVRRRARPTRTTASQACSSAPTTTSSSRSCPTSSSRGPAVCWFSAPAASRPRVRRQRADRTRAGGARTC